MEYKRAAASDSAAVLAFFDEVRANVDAGTMWDGDYPSQELLREDVAEGRMYLVLCGGRIAAAGAMDGALDPFDEELFSSFKRTEPVRVLHRLAVLPQLRRRGFASSLLAFFEEEARRQGAFCLRLDTFASNESAIRLYHRSGYEKLGESVIWNGEGILILFEKKLRS